MRQALEKENGPSPDTMAVRGAVTLGKSVTNTIDSALNSILIPPSLRNAGSDLGGEGRNPFSFSILDGILPTGRVVPPEPEGPSRYDVDMGYLAQMQRITAGIAAKNASGQAPPPAFPGPYDGMYDHGD